MSSRVARRVLSTGTAISGSSSTGGRFGARGVPSARESGAKGTERIATSGRRAAETGERMSAIRRVAVVLRQRWKATVAGLAARAASAVGVARGREAGMSTAEYAVGTVAACGFAAVLYKVVTSTQVLHLLGDLVQRALTATF